MQVLLLLWVQVLLLLPELARPVMVRLFLRHLLILFLEIGSSMILLLYDVYFFLFLFCFWGLVFWPTILYLQTLAIVYI